MSIIRLDRAQVSSRQREGLWSVLLDDQTAIVVSSQGMASPALAGTGTPRVNARGRFARHATDIVPQTWRGWSSVATVARRDWGPTLRVVIDTADLEEGGLADLRLWVALSSGSPAGFDSPSSLHLAGLRFRSDDGPATWKAVVSDGEESETLDTSIAAEPAHDYELEVDLSDANAATFHVNGTFAGRLKVHLPGPAAGLGVHVLVENLTAAIRSFGIAQVQLLTR